MNDKMMITLVSIFYHSIIQITKSQLKNKQMKNRFKSLLKATIIIAIAVFTTIKATAQGNPGGPGSSGSGILGNGSPAGGGSPAVPFDGGMSIMLVASGIGYAAKKLKRK